jgi:hypothetical protein
MLHCFYHYAIISDAPPTKVLGETTQLELGLKDRYEAIISD